MAGGGGGGGGGGVVWCNGGEYVRQPIMFYNTQPSTVHLPSLQVNGAEILTFLKTKHHNPGRLHLADS